MKASKLIAELQKLVEKYGDLPVNRSSYYAGDMPVRSIDVYDKGGMGPDQDGFTSAAEFYLW